MVDKKMLKRVKCMAPVSFLATEAEGQPYLRAMTHFIDKDLTIWYPSKKRCGKVMHIRSNPKVAASFLDTAGTVPPITVYGLARIIEDRHIQEAVWSNYDPGIRSIVSEGPGSDNFVMIQVVPVKVVTNTYAGATTD